MLTRYEASKKDFTASEWRNYKEELKQRHDALEDKALFKQLRDEADCCDICGILKRDTYRLNIHHIIPRRFEESSNDRNNLMVLCTKCHSKLDTYISFANDIDEIYRRTNHFIDLHAGEAWE